MLCEDTGSGASPPRFAITDAASTSTFQEKLSGENNE